MTLQDLAAHPDRLSAGLRLPVATASVLIRVEDACADEWAKRQPLPAALKSTVRKRQEEFRAGRLAASRALERVGHSGPVWLDPAPDRTPRWPPGWIGSLSHSGGHALAAAAHGRWLRAVGVDIQEIASWRQIEAIRATVASAREWKLLESVDPAIAVTGLFSAKESLYKALFPQVGRFFDFSAATLVDVDDGRLTLRLSCDWSAQWPRGCVLEIGCLLTPQHVITAAHVMVSGP